MNISRHIFYAVITQLLLAVVFYVIFSIGGLLLAFGIGGQFGFPEFFGLPGYEASGSLGAMWGGLFGIGLGIAAGGALWKQTGDSTIPAGICLGMGLVMTAVGFTVDYETGQTIKLLFVFVEVVAALLATYFWHFKRVA